MIIIKILLAIVFTVYTVYMFMKYGNLGSVSGGWYKLNKDKKGWLFTAFMFYLAVSMFLIGGLSQGGYGWVYILASSGAAFVGAATRFKRKMTSGVHYAASGILIAGSVVALGMVDGRWLPLYVLSVLLAATLATSKLIKNPVYWFEIAAFVVIIAGMLL